MLILFRDNISHEFLQRLKVMPIAEFVIRDRVPFVFAAVTAITAIVFKKRSERQIELYVFTRERVVHRGRYCVPKVETVAR
jgi:hypothetical protein